MIIAIAVIFFVLFLKIVGLIFGAGLRVLGWMFGIVGFIISVLFSMMALGFAFYLFPILIIVGVVMIALKPF